MDTEALASAIQRGGLSQLAETAAMAELARRVVEDEIDYGASAQGRMARLLDRAGELVVTLGVIVWLVWLVGRITA